MSEQVICPVCGTANQKGSKFCNNCGSNLSQKNKNNQKSEPIAGKEKATEENSLEKNKGSDSKKLTAEENPTVITSDKDNNASITQKTQSKKISSKNAKIILGVIISACAAVVLIFFATSDIRTYKKALSEYNAKQYELSAEKFNALGDYKNSSDMLKKCQYEIGVQNFNNENFKEALNIFKKLADYEDATDYVKKCNYALSVDGQFMRALKKGLEDRWKFADSDEAATYAENNAMSIAVDKELDRIESFYEQSFNDSDLQTCARNYIDQLKASKAALTFYDSDYTQYDTKWTSSYNERCKLLNTFVNNYGFTVNKSFQKDLDDMLDNAETQLSVEADKEKFNSAMQNMIASIQFSTLNEGNSEYPNYTSRITLTNITEETFTGLYFDINVKDSAGNIIGTGQSDYYNSQIAPGEQVTINVWFNDNQTDYSGNTLEYKPNFTTASGITSY
jgi:hypothetical protein